MSGNLNAVAVGAVGAGLVFIWSGIKGASVLSTLQSIMQGKKPDGTNAYAIASPSDAATTPADTSKVTLAPGGTAAQNQATAKLLAAPYGWSTGPEWDALVWLWQHESGWRNTAENPAQGHAYGIPQALPPTKLPKAGQPPRLGGTSDAGAQISWGLNYIKGRYGSPTSAKAFWQSHNWY